MLSKFFKSVLLIVSMTVGNFCFGQSEELHFIFDTSASRNYRQNENQYIYYNNEIISCKVFYDYTHFPNYSIYPVHFDFILLKNNKYYCTEYDDHGNKMNEGIARKELKPYDELNIPIIDSNGITTGYKKILDYYKLCKDEFWHENFDSSYYNYDYGKYVNEKKDSVWIRIKRRNIESETTYRDGIVFKNEIVNLTGTGDKRIADILVRKWEIEDLFDIPIIFRPATSFQKTSNYLEFYKNGTYACYSWLSQPQESTGKWELIKNNTIIKMTFQNTEIFYSIDYISRYGLNLTNMEYLK